MLQEHALIRDWELLADSVVPLLFESKPGGRSRNAAEAKTAWAVGNTADAVAIAAAFRQVRPVESPDLHVYAGVPRTSGARHNPTPSVQFSLSDISCIPLEERERLFRRSDRGFVPDDVIAGQVLLAEPNELVDLVSVRSRDAREAEPDAVTGSLRKGGLLFLVDGSDTIVPCSGLEPVDGTGRIFRKLTGGTAAPRRAVTRLTGPAAVADRGAEWEDKPLTLAEQLMQTELVEGHLRLAWALARRFSRRGEATEDLDQVAQLALVKAARRYDPDRGIAFSTFATASILGELKRHFRDKTWMMRVPRSLQELFLSVKHAREELSQTLGGSPTCAQIAAHLGVSEEAVRDAVEAGDNYWPASLDTGLSEDGSPTEIAMIDPAFERSLDCHRLAEVLPRLDAREQLIIRRLYFDQWTQRQVAEEIGVSQMQVSRLLLRTVSKLRGWLADAA